MTLYPGLGTIKSHTQKSLQGRIDQKVTLSKNNWQLEIYYEGRAPDTMAKQFIIKGKGEVVPVLN
jgi:hypothetical protein